MLFIKLFKSFLKLPELHEGAKGLITEVCLKIPNHDENILAPKSKDCGWEKKKEDT